MPADQKKFGLGKTTAREMAAVMTKIVSCELAEPGSPARADDAALCDVALKMLHAQFYRSAIPRYLDAMPGATGNSIANKTGSLDAVRNDVAAVSTKNGMVIISAFTWNNKDHSWGTDQEGELTIAKLARTIVQSWSPEGLAAWPDAGSKTPPVTKIVVSPMCGSLLVLEERLLRRLQFGAVGKLFQGLFAQRLFM